MDITIKEQGGRLVVALSGDFDNAVCPDAEKALAPIFKCSDSDLVVDCTDLNYIASSGLRLMLSIYKHQRSIGHRSILTHMNEDVKEVFYLGGYLTIFEVEE